MIVFFVMLFAVVKAAGRLGFGQVSHLVSTFVNLAFGLTLGSVAVALALSFGLGGREAAGRQMEHWLSRLRGER